MIATGKTLSLFVPGLIDGPLDSSGIGSRAPALERILARSERDPESLPNTIEAALFALFDVPHHSGGDLPVAAITRNLDFGTSEPGWWIRADPVHLEPHGDGLVLQTGPGLRLSLPDAQQLLEGLKGLCAEDGIEIEARHPLRWYLKPAQPPEQLRTTPLAQVCGRNIGPFLPAGRDGPGWRRRLNEFQLMLHENAINHRRVDQGLWPINSVWFWGGGPAPPPVRVNWSALWTENPIAAGLAHHAGILWHPTSASFDTWSSAVRAGDHLVILDHDPINRSDENNHADSSRLARLEQHWFQPAINALSSGILETLILMVEGQRPFRVTRSDLRRWWRRARPLGAYRDSRDN